ncbi:hypothetical protein [Deinococcus sedimenti]|uniref:hypothetical protein n=1 Tax=Deinococcus sedimenti TaxID=1867090 RepID=UPI001663E245|nr:hypothetical protein [Deinococcus sedimenti]
MKRLTLIFAGLLLAGSAAAQSDTPTPSGGVQVWGGVGTEVYLLPTLSLGLSADVAQLPSGTLSVRGTASATLIPLPDVTGPIPVVGADLLFRGNRAGLNVYGGPSVGTILGAAWLLGGVVGVQGPLGQGNWGYFGEVKARYLVVPGQGVFAPGVNLGVTYRF